MPGMGRPRKPQAERWRGVSVSVSGRDYQDLGRLAFERFIRGGGGTARAFLTGEQPSVSSAVRYLLAQERQRRMVGRFCWFVVDFGEGEVVVALVDPITGEERVLKLADPEYSLLAPGADARLRTRIAEALVGTGYNLAADEPSPKPPATKPRAARPTKKERAR